MVKRYDEESVWDHIQAKDVPPEMADYVTDKLKEGYTYEQIRRQLGIRSSTGKAWKKIMSHIRQGFRVDGTAFLVQKANEMQNISRKLVEQINQAFDEGIEVPTKTGTVTIKGPSKELSMTIDAYNRLQQGFVKLGKDLGAFIDADGSRQGGSGGVTIVVKTNVPMPGVKDIEAHQARNSSHLPVIEVEKANAKP